MVTFTALLDESGTPHLSSSNDKLLFSVGVLVPEDPDNLRQQILSARALCSDPRVQKRGYFHASQDNRVVHQFLCECLKTAKFDFNMLFADKDMAATYSAVKTAGDLHQYLLREAINTVATQCRSLDLLIGKHPETLKSETIVDRVLRYHEKQQIIEAITFPFAKTIRTKFKIQLVTPNDEPLMDVVDYLMWSHQRAEFKDDEHWHIFLPGSRLRARFKQGERFPGISRISTSSNWFPKDPVLETMQFRQLISRSLKRPLRPELISAIGTCINRGQENPSLKIAQELGERLLGNDRTSRMSFEFGRALFEVFDTEALPILLSEEELVIIKRGAALCAWLAGNEGRRPPFEAWEKMLEAFFSLITGQEARIIVE
jgi:hypothetical protein